MPSSASDWSSDVCSSDRSEEHTSELQSLAYLVCRLLISEKHTSELQSLAYLVCRLLLEKKKKSTCDLEHTYLQASIPCCHCHPPRPQPDGRHEQLTWPHY